MSMAFLIIWAAEQEKRPAAGDRLGGQFALLDHERHTKTRPREELVPAGP